MTSEPRPTIDELIEASSLGTPEAKAHRESVPDEVARRIVERSREIGPDLRPCICPSVVNTDVPPVLIHGLPLAVKGCPQHVYRYAFQQHAAVLWPDDPENAKLAGEDRICGNEREPDGEPCVGWLRFKPGDVQAKCTVCGGWEGRYARTAESLESPAS